MASLLDDVHDDEFKLFEVTVAQSLHILVEIVQNSHVYQWIAIGI